jgi:hypothetical protein
MHAGTTRDGTRMARALMDNDGTWSIGNLYWIHSDIGKMRRWVSTYERRIDDIHRSLEPSESPFIRSRWQMSLEEIYQAYIGNFFNDEQVARSYAEYEVRENAEDRKRWEEREAKKRDPAYIKQMRDQEELYQDLLAKMQKKVAKEEANPDWRYKALTRMTDLATRRLLAFAGDAPAERHRGATITGACYCCGKTLTDKISLERGIGPECIKFLRTYDLTNLVRLKNEMVAAHPDKGGKHDAFLKAYTLYTEAKAAAERSLTH